MELLVISCWLAAVAALAFLAGCLISVGLRDVVRRWVLWLPSPAEPLMWHAGEEPATVKLDRKKQDVEPGFTLLRVPNDVMRAIEHRAVRSGFTRQQFIQAALQRASDWGPMEQMDALIAWWRDYEAEEGLTGGPVEPAGRQTLIDRGLADAVFAERARWSWETERES